MVGCHTVLDELQFHYDYTDHRFTMLIFACISLDVGISLICVGRRLELSGKPQAFMQKSAKFNL